MTHMRWLHNHVRRESTAGCSGSEHRGLFWRLLHQKAVEHARAPEEDALVAEENTMEPSVMLKEDETDDQKEVNQKQRGKPPRQLRWQLQSCLHSALTTWQS